MTSHGVDLASTKSNYDMVTFRSVLSTTLAQLVLPMSGKFTLIMSVAVARTPEISSQTAVACLAALICFRADRCSPWWQYITAGSAPGSTDNYLHHIDDITTAGPHSARTTVAAVSTFPWWCW